MKKINELRGEPRGLKAKPALLRGLAASWMLSFGPPLEAARIPVAASLVEVNPGDGECSLLEAMENAAGDTAVHFDCVGGDGADEVLLAEGSLYVLATGSGDTAFPIVSGDLTVSGRGATLRRSFVGGTSPFRFFLVNSSGSLKLFDLRMTGGEIDSNFLDGGGAIRLNGGSLEATGCEFIGNRVTNSGYGGAIFSADAEVVLTRTRFLQNEVETTVVNEGGGAIAVLDGELTVHQGAFIDNSTVGIGGGGALYLEGLGDQGLEFDALALLENTTISGNSAAAGGGIYVLIQPGGVNVGALASLNFVTLINNRAAVGAGLRVVNAVDLNAVAFYQNSILHHNGTVNPLGMVIGTDCSVGFTTGTVSGGGNFLDPSDFCNQDLQDVTAIDATEHIDVVLNVDHHPPIPGGLLHENGVIGCEPGVTVDQLGKVRASGPGLGDSGCEIGAIEFNPPFYFDGFESGDTTAWPVLSP